MSINRAEQQLQDRLINDVEQLKRDIRDLKTAQLIGGDSTKVTAGPNLLGIWTVAAGEEFFFGVRHTPNQPIIGLANLMVDLRIDTDSSAFYYPTGASLTAAQKKAVGKGYTHWLDRTLSNDATGERFWVFRLPNDDTVTHTYYFRARVYAINNPAAIGT